MGVRGGTWVQSTGWEREWNICLLVLFGTKGSTFCELALGDSMEGLLSA